MAQQSEAIATLQCCLIAANSPKVEAALPPKFDGQREVVVGFVRGNPLKSKDPLQSL